MVHERPLRTPKKKKKEKKKKTKTHQQKEGGMLGVCNVKQVVSKGMGDPMHEKHAPPVHESPSSLNFFKSGGPYSPKKEDKEIASLRESQNGRAEAGSLHEIKKVI